MEKVKSGQRTNTICLLILACVAVGVSLYMLAPVLVPFVLALFFTYCLTPLIDFQQSRLKFPKMLALVVTALLGVLILVITGGVVLATVRQMSENGGAYQVQIAKLFERIAAAVPIQKLGLDPNEVAESLKKLPQMALRGILPAIVDSSMSVISNGALVVIFMLFILMGRSPMVDKNDNILNEIESRVKKYIISKVLVSMITAALVWLTLWLLKVDFALVFGVLAFVLNFIPNVGSAIATLLPLPIVILSPEHTILAKFAAILIPGAIQLIMGNIVEPKIMGETLDLHPITILLTLIFFGMIWGIPGMFLATPITAVIKIILERSSSGKAVAEVLAGRLDALKRVKKGSLE